MSKIDFTIPEFSDEVKRSFELLKEEVGNQNVDAWASSVYAEFSVFPYDYKLVQINKARKTIFDYVYRVVNEEPKEHDLRSSYWACIRHYHEKHLKEMLSIVLPMDRMQCLLKLFRCDEKGNKIVGLVWCTHDFATALNDTNVKGTINRRIKVLFDHLPTVGRGLEMYLAATAPQKYAMESGDYSVYYLTPVDTHVPYPIPPKIKGYPVLETHMSEETALEQVKMMYDTPEVQGMLAEMEHEDMKYELNEEKFKMTDKVGWFEDFTESMLSIGVGEEFYKKLKTKIGNRVVARIVFAFMPRYIKTIRENGNPFSAIIQHACHSSTLDLKEFNPYFGVCPYGKNEAFNDVSGVSV